VFAMATNISLYEISSRLDKVFISSRTITDDEIKSHYARYLCVLSSGYIEESVKIIIRNYTSGKGHPNILNYVEATTRNLTNLNSEKLGIFLNAFNNNWKDQFDSLVTDEEKASLDSIVANRNLIVHGQNVGISYVRVTAWHANVKKVIEKISKLVNP
jgi:HEPN superfamily RiboL-PSP-like protein